MANLSGESQDKLGRTLAWIEELDLQKRLGKISEEQYRERIARSITARERLLDRAKVNSDLLRKWALIDNLTGLPNQRYLTRTLDKEIVSARRTSSELGLLLLDIDHFKEVNDEYGHPAGDEVLRRIGSLLIRIVRGGDFAGRYGGEEFEVIEVNPQFSKEGTDGLLIAAERLRMAIHGEEIDFLRGNHISVSIGATRFRGDDTSKSIFQRVDSALYQSKHEGRNKVTLL